MDCNHYVSDLINEARIDAQQFPTLTTVTAHAYKESANFSNGEILLENLSVHSGAE